MIALQVLFLIGCGGDPEVDPAEEPKALTSSEATDCSGAKNTCTDYALYWKKACPDGSRCITFKNSCTTPVALAYQIGCNGDGTKGAPQCDCTNGETLPPGTSLYWQIVDGDYASCLPSWTPACLTAGLAVLANDTTPSCTTGTRIEFSAGNTADPYGHFDSYNLSRIEGYSVPVAFGPDLTCAKDSANHDCRPLVCASDTCEDAYSTPTSGTCPDGRSPQGNCQDTFSDPKGYTVTYCPEPVPASCQDAKACP